MAKPRDPKHVVFFHPDLGIGGAERLVVDAAVGLQDLGHKVTIFTSHCDPKHCFDEARDGTLDVRVRGDSIAPPSLLNRFSILCAILRQLHLILQICIFSSELRELRPDVFFVDQLSAGIPLLRIFNPEARALFYCHFPDKLLAYRESVVKRLYRIPFDWIESWTTGCSDVIVVNSNFTQGIFSEAFPQLRHREPTVVYPCVTEEGSDAGRDTADPATEGRKKQLWRGKKVVLSINRFERKKDIALAIRAFAKLGPTVRRGARLVLAGGYDPRMAENVNYHHELISLSDSLGLESATTNNLVTAMSIPSDIDVLFLLSVPASLKATLLQSADLLLYTPKYEHFGIVPLEAMLARLPVLAAKTGGPKESVVDGKCGWLRDVEATEEWAEIVEKALAHATEEELGRMGDYGRQRVLEKFSQKSMALRLDGEVTQMMQSKQRPRLVGPRVVLTGSCLVGFASAALWWMLR